MASARELELERCVIVRIRADHDHDRTKLAKIGTVYAVCLFQRAMGNRVAPNAMDADAKEAKRSGGVRWRLRGGASVWSRRLFSVCFLLAPKNFHVRFNGASRRRAFQFSFLQVGCASTANDEMGARLQHKKDSQQPHHKRHTVS